MLINLEKLSKKYNLDLTAIAHIGAHVGYEVKNYVNIFGEIPIYLFEPQKNIFNKVTTYLDNNQLMVRQIDKYQKILNDFKTNKSSEIAASVLTNSL